MDNRAFNQWKRDIEIIENYKKRNKMKQKKLLIKGLIVLAIIGAGIILYINTIERGSAFEFGTMEFPLYEPQPKK